MEMFLQKNSYSIYNRNASQAALCKERHFEATILDAEVVDLVNDTSA